MDAAVEAIVRRELGTPPDDVRRVSEGLLHDTYELSCDGARYVLQFAAGDTEDRRDSLQRGAYWYAALRDGPVPVPALVSDGVGECDGREYVLVERCPGETATGDISPERTRRAGRCLARIHGARTFEAVGWLRVDDGDPSVGPYEAGSHAEHVRHVVEESARTLRAHGLDDAAAALDRLVERLDGVPPETVRPVLCHGDFSPGNLLFRDDSLTGVVDFDRAYAGSAHRDLARAGNAFWTHEPGADWPVRETLYDGYRSVRPLGDAFDDVEPLYRVETQAEAVAGMLELGELSASEQSFYAERLDEAADEVGDSG